MTEKWFNGVRFGPLKVNNTPNERLWCGPSALAIVSGRPYEEALELVVKSKSIQQRSYKVVGVNINMVNHYIEHWLKFRYKIYSPYISYTKYEKEFKKDTVYFVARRSHIVVMCNGKMVDNFYKSPSPPFPFRIDNPIIEYVVELFNPIKPLRGKRYRRKQSGP